MAHPSPQLGTLTWQTSSELRVTAHPLLFGLWDTGRLNLVLPLRLPIWYIQVDNHPALNAEGEVESNGM